MVSVKCGSAVPDSNQEIHCTNEFYFASICEVSCNNQSKLHAKRDSRIICGVDGHWDKTFPKCISK